MSIFFIVYAIFYLFLSNLILSLYFIFFMRAMIPYEFFIFGICLSVCYQVGPMSQVRGYH